MKKWEDIIKEKLEGYESTLPEGSLSDFRSRRAAAAGTPVARRFPWGWAVAAVVAVGLASVLFLHRPDGSENSIQVISQPAVAGIPEATESPETVPAQPRIAQAAVSETTGEPARSLPKAESAGIPTGMETALNMDEQETAVDTEVPEADANTANPGATEVAEAETATEPDGTVAIAPETPADVTETPSPFIPHGGRSRPVLLKMAPVAGAVAGGSLLAALVTPMLLPTGTPGYAADMRSMNGTVDSPSRPVDYARLFSASMTAYILSGTAQEHAITTTHSFPLRLGLSTRIPLSDRWNITTGLDYSRYSTMFTHPLYGEQQQLAHYLGVPVRLDWTLLRNRWLDVYLGGGLVEELCVGATLGGQKMKRDGLTLSLLGAGGLQLNMTPWLGLYVEPQLSWAIPSENRVLDTYRTKTPLMFSISSGLRISVINQK